MGVSAFREQIGNSAVKRRWPLCPVCRNTSRKNGCSFLMSVAGRNTTSFAGNAKGAASRASVSPSSNAHTIYRKGEPDNDRLSEQHSRKAGNHQGKRDYTQGGALAVVSLYSLRQGHAAARRRSQAHLYRTNGSIDIAGAARSILAVTRTATCIENFYTFCDCTDSIIFLCRRAEPEYWKKFLKVLCSSVSGRSNRGACLHYFFTICIITASSRSRCRSSDHGVELYRRIDF